MLLHKECSTSENCCKLNEGVALKARKAKQREYKKDWAPIVHALTDEQLSKANLLLQSLAIVLWCIQYGSKYVSRRLFADVAADVWRDFKGTAYDQDGEAYELRDIDYLLGGANDPHFSWLREFFSYALSAPDHELNARMKEHVRFIDLTIKAGGPALWRNLMKDI